MFPVCTIFDLLDGARDLGGAVRALRGEYRSAVGLRCLWAYESVGRLNITK